MGVRRAPIKRHGGELRCEPHHGARDDGEKVYEVLANYGLFRITYVGQIETAGTTVRRKFFNQRTIVIVVCRNGGKVWRGKSVIEFAGMHWGEARWARES